MKVHSARPGVHEVILVFAAITITSISCCPRMKMAGIQHVSTFPPMPTLVQLQVYGEAKQPEMAAFHIDSGPSLHSF